MSVTFYILSTAYSISIAANPTPTAQIDRRASNAEPNEPRILVFAV